MAELTVRMEKRPGASRKDLANVFASASCSPPSDYLEFMAETNGSEGPIGKAYLAIYSIQELVDTNADTFELEPGLLFFGTDRGGEGYAFELDARKSIVAVEFADLDRARAKVMGRTFLDFLETVGSEGATSP